jgi:hypothetical protein
MPTEAARDPREADTDGDARKILSTTIASLKSLIRVIQGQKQTLFGNTSIERFRSVEFILLTFIVSVCQPEGAQFFPPICRYVSRAD